jgi:hypothetical protein
MAPLLEHPHSRPAHRSGERPVHRSGERILEKRAGSLLCTRCGYAISVEAIDSLPECPNCYGRRFRDAPLFDRPTVASIPIEAPAEAPDWLFEVRASLELPGHHLAFEDTAGHLVVVPLQSGWTRIGRSAAADLRLDNPTVSRRHALIVLTEAGDLRALDDRSLNGLFVNGVRVDWAPLSDGDELEIGRYRLYVLEA